MRGGGLIFSEGARERARKYISLCNPPPAPLHPGGRRERGKKRISVDATARRGDGIAAKFLRSLRNPFSLRSCSDSYGAPEARRGSSIPLLSPRDTTGGLAFRGLGRVLQSPGSICLSLSSTPLLATAAAGLSDPKRELPTDFVRY